MRFIVFLIFLIFTPAVLASATVDRGIEASMAGDYDTALSIWEQLGSEGDKKAMIEAGLIYHQGLGRPANYEKAIDWYLKAMNGDTLNNMGVMFRDGTGLPENRKIAYLMFLTVHMTDMGSEATIMRANRNLRREVADLPKSEIQEAICYTYDYLIAYIKSRGSIKGIPLDLRASSERKRIKDLDWWLEGEVEPFECPNGT